VQREISPAKDETRRLPQDPRRCPNRKPAESREIVGGKFAPAHAAGCSEPNRAESSRAARRNPRKRARSQSLCTCHHSSDGRRRIASHLTSHPSMKLNDIPNSQYELGPLPDRYTEE